MLGKFFECEADKNVKYYRFIQTERKYGMVVDFLSTK